MLVEKNFNSLKSSPLGFLPSENPSIFKEWFEFNLSRIGIFVVNSKKVRTINNKHPLKLLRSNLNIQ